MSVLYLVTHLDKEDAEFYKISYWCNVQNDNAMYLKKVTVIKNPTHKKKPCQHIQIKELQWHKFKNYMQTIEKYFAVLFSQKCRSVSSTKKPSGHIRVN